MQETWSFWALCRFSWVVMQLFWVEVLPPRRWACPSRPRWRLLLQKRTSKHSSLKSEIPPHLWWFTFSKGHPRTIVDFMWAPQLKAEQQQPQHFKQIHSASSKSHERHEGTGKKLLAVPDLYPIAHWYVCIVQTQVCPPWASCRGCQAFEWFHVWPVSPDRCWWPPLCLDDLVIPAASEQVNTMVCLSTHSSYSFSQWFLLRGDTITLTFALGE